MKMKAVCDQTGLTRRTVLFYEEQGLLSPKKTRSNGRDYRDFSEADVETLQEIAALRRAWFTIDEIRRMEEAPEDIGEIFSTYRQWLLRQKQELDGLIQAASRIDPNTLESRRQLSGLIQQEAEKLPLPQTDITPHFRYLDDVEEGPKLVEYQTNLDESGDIRKPFRKMVQYKLGAYSYVDTMLKEEFSVEECRREEENGTVAYRIDRDSRHLKWVKGFLTAVIFLFGYLTFFYFESRRLDDPPTWPFAVVFLTAVFLRLLLAFITWRKDRHRLIQYEAQKGKPRIK